MAYGEAVEEFRRRKDEHFAAGRGPVSPETFRGLSYYPPDPTWVFQVELEAGPESQTAFTLDTNTGDTRTMTRFGSVTLDLPEGPQTLSVFAPLGEERPQRVFIPFRDATSGSETYAAGRYLDAPLSPGPNGLEVQVDFNLAYHPYCAYGEGWTCPLPPLENRLAGAVRAGERLTPERS
ncbi:DUF1684 domain-containing protein [Deinococcus koreensis]|uniref:DUF1684 domain-containing protein n=1 Tax=Deinococcus koreensis TaxID=2054903 RepID=A0A2K3UWG8_9DEIO|nr:DUF1684 domain-containing protein [Deinococcus koreensis]PNY80877.1 hypothetical protein CVO96_05400 [Deinococcus koreensis]